MLHVNLRELPRVSILGQVRQRGGWKNERRAQKKNLMLFVQEGDLSIDMGRQRFCLHKGDYVLIPMGQAYQPSTEEGCRYHFVHFELAEPIALLDEPQEEAVSARRQEAFEGVRDPSAYALPVDTHEGLLLPMCAGLGDMQEKIWLLLAECDVHRCNLTPQRKITMDLRFAEMLNLLDRPAPGAGVPPKAAPPVLSRMLLYIHQHYAENVTLSGLSERFELSRQYIALLFREHVGVTVTQYVNQLKLNHSLDLLRYSTFRIGEVAERLGFANAYYFCRLFRRQFGMSPSEYIRLNSEKES